MGWFTSSAISINPMNINAIQLSALSKLNWGFILFQNRLQLVILAYGMSFKDNSYLERQISEELDKSSRYNGSYWYNFLLLNEINAEGFNRLLCTALVLS